jgi:hypothetical protein
MQTIQSKANISLSTAATNAEKSVGPMSLIRLIRRVKPCYAIISIHD